MNEKMLQIRLRDPIFDISVAIETLPDEFDPIIESEIFQWKPVKEETDIAGSALYKCENANRLEED